MQGVHPFAESLDDIGPIAASLRDLKLATELLLGRAMSVPIGPIRVARLGGYFLECVEADVLSALADIASHLGVLPTVELERAGIARSAAYVMTAIEGGSLHLPDLRVRAMSFDASTRDRLIAGALMPQSMHADAVRFQKDFKHGFERLFHDHDVLIAPCTPCIAPLISNSFFNWNGASVPARSHLGVLTQPISLAGLPVIAVPLRRPGLLPMGLQLIAASGREDILFELARQLDAAGITGATSPLPMDVNR
jgi:aspartyl-tRNA(Asn)/glutamyl-tRNA(Gln) amidotransferase subunit A